MIKVECPGLGVQGYRLRTEINARQQDVVKIQTERFREQVSHGVRSSIRHTLLAGGKDLPL